MSCEIYNGLCVVFPDFIYRTSYPSLCGYIGQFRIRYLCCTAFSQRGGMGAPITTESYFVSYFFETRRDDPLLFQPINHILQHIFFRRSKIKATGFKRSAAHLPSCVVSINREQRSAS